MGTGTRRISRQGCLVLTAAHVVAPVARTKPTVHIAGMELPATAIREGNFERVDLTLLSIDDEQKLPIYLQMRRMSLCDNKPWPGESVIVAIPEGTARSHIMLPSLLPLSTSAIRVLWTPTICISPATATVEPWRCLLR